MEAQKLQNLSRRERQIMDVMFALGQGTTAEIRRAMTDPPSYSTVRAQLRVLEGKGFVTHQEKGPRYLYAPTIPAENARDSALQHLKQTFFGNSTAGVVSALLDLPDCDLSEDDLERLRGLIEQAREEGK
ncbi:MAG: BlaI/MecI/CopY family transcriptional regulator [bacterium]|nr:BlaI/MecI/CopY family transcriptional regulator [bacterium]